MSSEPSAAKAIPTGPSAPVIALDEPQASGSTPAESGAKAGGPPPLPAAYRAGQAGLLRAVPLAASPAAVPQAATGELREGVVEEELRSSWLSNAPSWLVSMVFHLVLMLVLALFTAQRRPGTASGEPLVATMEETPALETLEKSRIDPEPPIPIPVVAEVVPGPAKLEPQAVQVESKAIAGAAPVLTFDPLGHVAASHDLMARAGTIAGDALSGRGQAARSRMVTRYGGTPASELAVNSALRWLARHRMGDGGWTFQLTAVPECAGKCSGSGRLAVGRIAATGLALLPFLGAGQTHREGDYRNVVKEGLFYLTRQMKVTPLGGALNEPGGRMYSHGIASIVLCEAYAMTGDRALHGPAQQAVNFICRVQDPVGGGWRYEPFQPGDTSVVGWQIMALKSAMCAQLSVPAQVLRKASEFLDHVQAEEGAMYGYTFPGDGAATTAIGLLCRMHLGWSKDQPALRRGVQLLSQTGPSPGDMYFDYYATQVLRHWEGDAWQRWNQRMRDTLVASQYQKGHERGSWYMPDGDYGASLGGRLYCTAMAAMILEIYYRHMPIYSKRTLEANFPD
jgi:hypothetical protein